MQNDCNEESCNARGRSLTTGGGTTNVERCAQADEANQESILEGKESGNSKEGEEREREGTIDDFLEDGFKEIDATIES